MVLGQEHLVTFWSVAKCVLCCGASIMKQQIKGSLTFVGWFSLQPHTPWSIIILSVGQAAICLQFASLSYNMIEIVHHSEFPLFGTHRWVMVLK